MTSKSLIFFGNERLSTGFEPTGAPTLQALIDAGYPIAAVVSHYHAGRSRTGRSLEIEAIATKHGIPVLLPNKPAEIIDQLADYHALAAVLVAYGRIIPQSVIDIFPLGIINIHPSLLPAYRGPTPIEQAMLDGTPKTGVSLMQLASQMDAGPVYAQTELPLTGTETKQELTATLLRLGGELLLTNLPAILDGSLTPVPQQPPATYCQLLTKQDGLVDFSKPATQLEREVRAFLGWPKSRAEIFGQSVILLKTRVVQPNQSLTNSEQANDPNFKAPASASDLIMPCSNDTNLEILELIAPSGKRMSGEAFMRGYQNSPTSP